MQNKIGKISLRERRLMRKAFKAGLAGELEVSYWPKTLLLCNAGGFNLWFKETFKDGKA